MLGSQGTSGMSTSQVGFGRNPAVYKEPKKKISLYQYLLNKTLKSLVSNTYDARNPATWPGSESMQRLVANAYGDGYSTPSGADRPSPRVISNQVCNQPDGVIVANPKGCSDMWWLWGQFVDHDVGLVGTTQDSFNIAVPTGDTFFDPGSAGNVEMTFHRSEFAVGTSVPGTPREQTTTITSFLDATNVYGTTTARNTWLREGTKGRLKTSPGNMLPITDDGAIDNAGDVGKHPFGAGDVRANENVALTTMHTIWMREHNWWANKIYKEKPSLTDDEIYEKARIMVESEVQAITFNEFLPLLLGDDAIPAYTAYDDGIDIKIANEFSAVAYRFGHSCVSDTIKRTTVSGAEHAKGHISLKDALFAPEPYANDGAFEATLRGCAKTVCQKLDPKIVNSLRNFLFGAPGSGGLDLASLNIQRGRDHGFPDYNTMRVGLGLTAKASFAEITSDTAVQTALSTAYGGDISKIDPWVGGLCEDPVTGSQLGELFHKICKDQFIRLRDGDELWYENRLNANQIRFVNLTKLSTVIKRNSKLNKSIQKLCMKAV